MTKLNQQELTQKLNQKFQTIELLPKQKKFLYHILRNPNAKFVWYVGGFGSGKSFVGCYTSIILSLLYPKNTGLVARNTLRNLKRTTQKTFFHVLENVIGLTPDTETRTFHKGDQVIRFWNGSEIYFSGLDEVDKLKSLELGFFYIDEVDEVNGEVFLVSQGRLRNPNVPRRVGFITSNSEGKNWTYRLFIRGITPNGFELSEDEKKHYYVLRASSLENKFLPPDYVESLLQYKGDKFKRYVLGSFEIFEGQVFDEFSRHQHVIKPIQLPKDLPVIYGLDHGSAHPTAVVECRIGYDGTIFVTRLHYLAGEPVSTHAKALLQRIKSQGFENYELIADPSIFNKTQQPTPDKPFIYSIADEYRDFGLHPIPANNDIMAGINRMKELFQQGKIKIFENCETLIEELEAYKRKKDSSGYTHNKPSEKQSDHAIDALRYVVMTKFPPPAKPIAKNKYHEDILYHKRLTNGIQPFID